MIKKGDMKKEIIAEKAWELFAEKGYAYTSMADIARALGIKKPSLYHHFESRELMTKFAIELKWNQYIDGIASGGIEITYSISRLKYSIFSLRNELPKTEKENIETIDRHVIFLKARAEDAEGIDFNIFEWNAAMGAALTYGWPK